MLLLRGVAITRRDCFKLKPRRVLVQPGPEHILDLFQIAIRIEQLSDRSREGIIAKAAILRELSRINWFLWHGNVVRVNDTPSALMDDIDGAREESRQSGRPPQVVLRELFRALDEFDTYIDGNAGAIVNYSERYRCGERISTGFVELPINQLLAKRLVKRQQMRWIRRGARTAADARP